MDLDQTDLDRETTSLKPIVIRLASRTIYKEAIHGQRLIIKIKSHWRISQSESLTSIMTCKRRFGAHPAPIAIDPRFKH